MNRSVNRSRRDRRRAVPGAVAAVLVLSACTSSSPPEPYGAAQTPVADAPERCTALSRATIVWPDPTTRTTAVAWREAGMKLDDRRGPGYVLPAHCEVEGRLQDRTGVDGRPYAIRFRVRLPADWNGKLVFEGNGGTGGSLGPTVAAPAGAATPALMRGYAVVSQDTGHDNDVNSDRTRGGASAFGFDPKARENYGGGSLAIVARTARTVTQAYYERMPTRTYFVGCSKGGQEGMVVAQRHPELFDGVIAGAPGFALPRAAVAEAWDTQAFASLLPKEPGDRAPVAARLSSTFTNAQFAAVREAVLAACDADDGVRDGITGDLAACTWTRVAPELKRRICDGGASCLSAAQVSVLDRVLSGARDSRGRALYADWPIDAGIGTAGWRAWKIGPEGAPFPGVNVAMGGPALATIFTTPPTAIADEPQSAFEYVLKFDFDRDAPRLYATDAPFRRSAWTDVGARSPDLSGLRARGAKLIVPHGASDPVFSLNDTLAWWREVDERNGGRASAFVRVFAVPGMAHCGEGPATTEFDTLTALEQWVEQGRAPDRIEARAGADTPWPGRTRPLCPYPKVARFAGGDVESARSFRCE